MDAAITLFKRTALLFSIVLLAIAPWRAQAQSFSSPAAGTVYSLAGNTIVNVGGTGDNSIPAAPITFSVSVSYDDNAPHWLFVGSDNSGITACTGGTATYTTPYALGMQLGCLGGQVQGTHTAHVTLTATNPAGAGSVTFQVSYTSGSVGGGTITANPNPLYVTLASGAVTTQYINLSASSTAAIGFNLVSTSPATWLSVSASGTTVPSGTNTASLTVYVNATNITTSQSTTIQLTYGSNTLNIPVYLTISGSGTGTLGFSTGNSIPWTYTSGGGAPSPQYVSLYNSSATYYSFSITGNSPVFLLVNGSSTTGAGYTVGGGLTLTTTNLTSLVTGTYTAYVNVTDYNGLTGTLTVTLTVNGGTTTGITISPNPFNISASYGGGCCTYQNFTVTSSVAGNLAISLSGLPSGVTVFNPPSTISAGSATTITLQINPAGLPSVTYYGYVTVTVNSTTTQTGSVNLTIGSGGGTTTGSSVAPASLQYAFQSGSSVNLAGQAITIVGNGSFAISSPVYTGGSTSKAWLSIDRVSGAMSPQGSLVNVAHTRRLHGHI